MARRLRRSTTLLDVEMSCFANDQCQIRCERGSFNNFSAQREITNNHHVTVLDNYCIADM
jgi:hypothetical protein